MTIGEGKVSPGRTSSIEDDFPQEVFDAGFYLRTYPDVKAAGVDPWAHFMSWGHKEGRIWSKAAEPLAPALRAWAARVPRDERRPILDLLELIPPEHRSTLLADPRAWRMLREMTHPVFYRMQEVVAKGASTGGGEDAVQAIERSRADILSSAPTESVDEVLTDFLSDGIHRGLRHSVLFHPEWYTSVVLGDLGGLPDGHLLFHWLAVGFPARVSPTPLFDEEYYERSHADMARLSTWSFEHFVSNGCYELFRAPSPMVNHRLGTGKHSRPHRVPIVADIILSDEDLSGISGTSVVEERALMARRLLARLDAPEMTELVARAYEIEPMIRKPYTARKVSLPPMVSHAHELFERGERLRRSMPVVQIDQIVVLPHVRMAGSARVAGEFVQALHDLGLSGSTIVLTTDLDEFQRPDWFPEDVILVDVAAHCRGLPDEARARLLLDVVRGLRPRRVVNINSALCWSMYTLFGRQLSTMTELSAYLFTWEIDKQGNKGGYPIRALQDCLSNLTAVLVDSKPLHDELTWRYGHSSVLRQAFHLVHTPADYVEATDHSDVFATRREQGRVLRAFWAGRFDRQKRFDLVVDIATMLPELEIWVWGKTVLGGSDIDFAHLPRNIRLQGTYGHFDDLPVESCDFFLYTAEWDGVPTILIDAAARGVAVVASAVGGVVDLVTEETGFPVADALDPTAYVSTIEKMLSSPTEVGRRAARLRDDVRSICSRESYRRKVATALGLDDPRTTTSEEAAP
ncbi:glycosyltransferase [Isoptericola jiangsuensis]|uniref:glycosyltransferase n=1 Tax=Isoptericola jiangsuensis TaxID=548579 RepID=UPI003AAA628B